MNYEFIKIICSQKLGLIVLKPMTIYFPKWIVPIHNVIAPFMEMGLNGSNFMEDRKWNFQK